jgi:hypothetical protein
MSLHINDLIEHALYQSDKHRAYIVRIGDNVYQAAYRTRLLESDKVFSARITHSWLDDTFHGIFNAEDYSVVFGKYVTVPTWRDCLIVQDVNLGTGNVISEPKPPAHYINDFTIIRFEKMLCMHRFERPDTRQIVVQLCYPEHDIELVVSLESSNAIRLAFETYVKSL